MRSDRSPIAPQLRVPANWESQATPRPGILQVMTPRTVPASGLAPCITLTVADTDLGISAHQQNLCRQIRDTFERVDIEDSDIYDSTRAPTSPICGSSTAPPGTT